MRLLLPVLGITFLLSGLSAQETAKGVYDKMTATQKDLSAPGARPDRAKIEEFQKSVKDTLAANEKLFAEGDGVYYRAKLQQMSADQKGAADSYKAYFAANPGTDLSHEARLAIAQSTPREDNAAARRLAAEIKADKLSEPSKAALDRLHKGWKADDTRIGLTGKDAPTIASLKVLNAPGEFTFAGQKGKVVVVDFWATWCGPCRQIIPDLVKLQEKHGAHGLQIVGVTKFYGYGTDFTDGPTNGKQVGGREPEKKLSEADELKINENFVKAFTLNYPVVFVGADVAGDSFGVMGIPTCFVIGRDGKVVGHAVGSGKESHEKLEKMIADALGTGAAEASTKKGAGN